MHHQVLLKKVVLLAVHYSTGQNEEALCVGGKAFKTRLAHSVEVITTIKSLKLKFKCVCIAMCMNSLPM